MYSNSQFQATFLSFTSQSEESTLFYKMKQIFLCFLIAVLIQFRTCHPADTISDMMSSMSKFANKTESSMASMTSSKNTTQTFTSTKSNLLLEAVKKLDITNFTSDEEFLRLLFESVFSIIKDTKTEEFMFFSDLTVIVPSIIDKVVKQIQAAFFNIFFGGFVNAGVTAADMGLKIATALESGKLSAASQGIETAQNVADTITSNVPSNRITDAVTKLVNTSLDDADGAIKAAKTLETAGSNAISNVLNKLKMANASLNPVDKSSKVANAVETANQTAASEEVQNTKKIADKIAETLPSSGVINAVKKIADAGTKAVDISSKIANAVETAKLNAASEGVESAKKIADKVGDSLPSNGVTDAAKKIASTSLDGANGAVKAAKTLETTGSKAIGGVLSTLKSAGKQTAASEGAESAKTSASVNPVGINSNIASAVEKIPDKIGDSLPSNAVTNPVKKIASTSKDSDNGIVKAAKTLETVVSNAISGVLGSFKFG